jgi:hypothetical protein
MAGDEVRLARGAHRDAAAGRCLMEHVSVLAGEPYGSWPRCTHPALAALAALVNDRVSDSARGTLVSRAPALARARPADPALTWRLVEHAARAVLARHPGDAAAVRRLGRARRAQRVRDRLLPPRLVARLPRWVTDAVALAAADELVAAVHALLTASGPAGGHGRDRALLELLDTAIAVTLGGPTLVVGPLTEEVPAA